MDRAAESLHTGGGGGVPGLAGRWLALAVVLAVFGMLLAEPGEDKGRSKAAAEPARAFDFELLDINPASSDHGRMLRLSELYADRGVVLNFMASWCPPCREELPDLQDIHDSGRARVVCIAADEYGGTEDLESMLQDIGLTMPVLFAPEDAAKVLADHYPYFMLPATYVIDKSGHVRSSHEGMTKKKKLIAAIEKHLK